MFFFLFLSSGIVIIDVAHDDEIEVSVTFGQRLQLERERRGMKQETLASDIGCHSTYISQLESGKRRASLDIALKLDRALQLKPGT